MAKLWPKPSQPISEYIGEEPIKVHNQVRLGVVRNHLRLKTQSTSKRKINEIV